LCSTIAIALTATFAPGTAPASPDEIATQTEALLKRGFELRRQSRPREALELFKEAHAHNPSGLTLVQMGLAEQDLKLWVDAEEHLAQALRSPETPWMKKNRRLVQQALEEVRANFGFLEVLGEPAGAEISVVVGDGQPRVVGRLPLNSSVRLPAGHVTVKAASAGYSEKEGTAVLSAGSAVRMHLALEKLIPLEMLGERQSVKAAITQKSEGPGPQDDVLSRPFWTTTRKVAAGAVVVGTLATIAGGVIAVNEWQRCADAKSEGLACTNVTREMMVPGGAMGVAGLASIAAGGWFLVRGNPPIAVSIGPGMVALTLGGSF
jgi:hypothetical protein